jgi:hypothetical protein
LRNRRNRGRGRGVLRSIFQQTDPLDRPDVEPPPESRDQAAGVMLQRSRRSRHWAAAPRIPASF